ncbi:hypothetical protein F922_02631 [Acinetobacter baumannii NIPH 201]|nr:hypothetical protein F922_02631 [Acinetobacter baumannii NIPH 201]
MAGFAKNPEDARALRVLGAIRNNNLAAASVAGYGSYVVVGTVAAVSAAAPVVGRVAAPFYWYWSTLRRSRFNCWNCG